MDVEGLSLDSHADPAVSGLVSEGLSQSNAQRAANYTSGNAEARGLLNAAPHSDDSMAYGNKVQSAAIQQRYNAQYGRQEQEISIKAMRQADSDQVQKLQGASQLASQEVEMNKQKAILRNKINNQNKRARGQVLGNVLGIVGAVVAGYFTSGTGAGAGFAAGEAAGNAIGGS